MQIKKVGYTVSKLAEILTNMTKDGHGDLTVMIDISTDFKNLIAPAGRGDIGMASDGRKVLVIRRGGSIDPLANSPIINGGLINGKSN